MGFARSFRRQMKRRKEMTAKKRRKVMLEPLEPRILLSSETLSFSAASAAAADFTLQPQELDSAETLHLINDIDALSPTRATTPSLLFSADIQFSPNSHDPFLSILTAHSESVISELLDYLTKDLSL